MNVGYDRWRIIVHTGNMHSFVTTYKCGRVNAKPLTTGSIWWHSTGENICFHDDEWRCTASIGNVHRGRWRTGQWCPLVCFEYYVHLKCNRRMRWIWFPNFIIWNEMLKSPSITLPQSKFEVNSRTTNTASVLEYSPKRFL